MKYMIDKTNRPVYLQIYRQIRQDIISGIYPYHTKLPSIRLLCDELSVSTVTVDHAYALLCDEGYIESRERSGFIVVFRNDDSFAASSEKQPTKMSLEHSKRDYPDFPLSVLSKTMRKVISDTGEGTGLLERSPNLGTLELRDAIRTYLARNRGILADTKQIVIGSGSEHLYTLLVELLGRERVYAIEVPSYKKIEQVYKASDVRLEQLPLTRDGIDSRSLRNSSADVLHISPYRSYPSGVTASASKRHEYLRWAENKKRYIIEDDFESEFSVSRKPEETLFSHSQKDNVIYMNTFSKTISPSFRIGYMVLPKKLADEYEEKLGFFSCTVPTFEQLVVAELISNGDFERHINRVRRAKRKELNK